MIEVILMVLAVCLLPCALLACAACRVASRADRRTAAPALHAERRTLPAAPGTTLAPEPDLGLRPRRRWWALTPTRRTGA